MTATCRACHGRLIGEYPMVDAGQRLPDGTTALSDLRYCSDTCLWHHLHKENDE